MDTRLSYEDWKDYLSHCAQKQGPSHAMNQCEAHLGEIVCKDPFLAGMKEAFAKSSISESRRLLHVAQALGDAGYYLPMDALFQIGLPRREFIVKCNLTHGRLGDGLGQMNEYIHAMKSLNLVLIVNPYGTSSKNVLLSCSGEFDAELFVLDMNAPVSGYLKSEAYSCDFDRRLLARYASQLLCGLDEVAQFSWLKEKLDDAIVLHVRSGDGLFVGTNMSLPPLDYYISSIKGSGCNKAVVVAEPFNNKKDPFPSPVPSLIAAECEKLGVAGSLQSSDILGIDVAALFYAKKVVASNSAFSTMIPLYGDTCESLIIPDFPGGGNHWVQDECITYVDCWDGFDRDKWKESLDYRLAWVSGEVHSQ